MLCSRVARAVLVMLAAVVPVAAQAQKRPLSQADWDRWQSINGATLSADGKWVAYTQNPRVGEGEFIVHSVAGGSEYRVNLGYTNRDNNTPGGERGRGAAPPGGEVAEDVAVVVAGAVGPRAWDPSARTANTRS